MGWVQAQREMRYDFIRASIDMLVTMLLQDAGNVRAYEASDIKQVFSLAKMWISEHPELRQNYECLLVLLEKDWHISRNLVERNVVRLRNCLEDDKEELFFNCIDFRRAKMFEKLKELNALSVFIGF